MEKVSVSNPRSLLHCIARFSDREKLAFVTKHLSRREDFASGAALLALTVLDPLRPSIGSSRSRVSIGT